MTNEIGHLSGTGLSQIREGPTTERTEVKEKSQQADKATQAIASQQQRVEKAPPEQVEETVTDLNELVQELHRELKFAVDKDSGELVIKVMDSETDEVIRQIPREEVLRLRQRLEETSGALFQDSA